jgi:uncharacterized repeat protein (TIGR03803 family)
LVQATNGNLYGTTSTGGDTLNYFIGLGTVFKITPGGKLTTLYRFCEQFIPCTDGFYPYAGLVQATDGNLYGTTEYGGNNNCAVGDPGCGTIFRITTSGELTTLYSFCGQVPCTDGAYPYAGLVQATNGTFYGTTYSGGDVADTNCVGGCGAVFSLSVGLGPFVETVPTSGEVGATVKILGNSLKGATSVTFKGTAATFKVVSSSEIITTVPTGATTGTVKVVTPSGTLSSNVAFLVP